MNNRAYAVEPSLKPGVTVAIFDNTDASNLALGEMSIQHSRRVRRRHRRLRSMR